MVEHDLVAIVGGAAERSAVGVYELNALQLHVLHGHRAYVTYLHEYSPMINIHKHAYICIKPAQYVVQGIVKVE